MRLFLAMILVCAVNFYASADDYGPTPGSSFTYTDLIKLIDQHQVRTIDRLLPLLPESYRKYYQFIYRSQSLQNENTSPRFPRTMIYGADGKLVMAFTHGPDKKGLDTLELMSWNEDRKKFQFRELDFDGSHNPLTTPPANGVETCQACHGDRPNWEPYNFWPGVYGSVDRENCSASFIGGVEWKMYQDFQKNSRHKGRYGFLPNEIGNDLCDPKYAVDVGNGATTSPNANISDIFEALNTQRIGAEIARAKNFEKFKFVLSAINAGCFEDRENEIEEFFPEHFKPAGKNYDQTLQEIIKVANSQFLERLSELRKTNSPPSGSDPVRVPINFATEDDLGGEKTLAVVKYIMDRMGVDMSQWSTGFLDATYDFSYNAGTNASAVRDIVHGIFNIRKQAPGSCNELAIDSQEALFVTFRRTRGLTF